MILDYNIKKEDFVFGLDIGTRTVMGVLGFQKNNEFVVFEHAVVEHESRAMIDGQIHDIFKVANSVLKVKNILEERTNVELRDVSIAAAGRLLKTYLTKVQLNFDSEREIQRDIIKELELKGISEAQLKIKEDYKDSDMEYYSVGYSVVNYYLDEYIISNLEGHRSKDIAADVLVTFLPKAVVDSLYAVMDRVGLEVTNLTLEPIAAINVAIPEKLRLLNLALVDIGAGTSDIAITKDGAVIGYGMIPIAGDEISEQIVHKYLVDFQTAEKIKFKIGKEHDITFKDIIGLSHTISSEELLETVQDAIERLAEEISKKVCEVNGNKTPNAVFCVGGGSQIIGLTQKISEMLKISNERVAVRGGDSLINVIYECEALEAPDVITPIGICVTSIKQRGYDFIKVNLNREEVKLLNTKKLTVLDACMQKGFDHTNLLGRKGDSLFFKLNNERKRVRGESAEPSELFVNGKEASLETLIHEGDDILVQPAVNGKDAKAFIKDYIDYGSIKKVIVNGAYMEIVPICFINGQLVDKDQEIHNNDEVMIIEVNTILDLANYLDIVLDDKVIFTNQSEVSSSYLINDGDSIEFIVQNNDVPNDMSNDIPNDMSNDIPNDVPNGIPNDVPNDIPNDVSNDIPFFLNSIENENNESSVKINVNGHDVVMKGENTKYIFVDVFNFIDFDLSNPKGNIVLKLNGNRAAFTDPIKNGDIIEIYWDKANKVENI